MRPEIELSIVQQREVRLSSEEAALAEIKRLRSDELAAQAGGGTAYRFEELLQLSNETVPPLVFIHIARTAGTTLNKVLMRNYKFQAASYGNTFWTRWAPAEFLSFVRPPESPDDRIRPVFFGGHIDIRNDTSATCR